MSLQEQARALGDHTRHRIFRYVADAARPVDVPELTKHFGLNHNAIRQHLAKLVTAGLLTQTTRPSGGPGRPRLVFRVDPGADGRWGTAGPYQRLSLLLISVLTSDSTPEEVGRLAGRQLEVAVADPGRSQMDALGEAIARGGFDPSRRQRGDRVEFVLATCPFAEAAGADADTICGLHLGLARGLADQLDGVTVDNLIRRDPHRAGCLLQFHVDHPLAPQERT
ncbi:MAG: helix-turn-helix domain-containing protein [Acidimicrobiia bacterium]|nr:helix-turn-helix domain-containing protein [Acidimicrobiia bacterium]